MIRFDSGYEPRENRDRRCPSDGGQNNSQVVETSKRDQLMRQGRAKRCQRDDRTHDGAANCQQKRRVIRSFANLKSENRADPNQQTQFDAQRVQPGRDRKVRGEKQQVGDLEFESSHADLRLEKQLMVLRPRPRQ